MSSIKVGNAEIIALLDMNVGLPLQVVFPNVPEASWAPYAEMYPGTVKDGMMLTNFQAFAVRSAGQTVLVDMGAGPGPHEGLGGLTGNMLADMRAKGVDPGDVDTVVFTHLHFDHTGWAVHEGKPLCAKARYLAPEADWPMLGKVEYGFVDGSDLKSLQSAGKVELVSGEKQVTPEVTLLPTPGHTPGHQSIVIVSAGQRAFIAGDVAGTPALVQETDWHFSYDADAATAAATRKTVMERLERDGSTVAFGHFPAPGFGHIVRDGNRRVFRAL